METHKEVLYSAINDDIEKIKINHNFSDILKKKDIPEYAGYKFVLENFIPRYSIKYNDFLVNRKIEELMVARRLISALMKIDDAYIPDPEELYTTISFMDIYMMETPLKYPHYSIHGYIKSKKLLLTEFKPAVEDFIKHGANKDVVNTAISACSRASLVVGETREDKLGHFALICQLLTAINYHLGVDTYIKFVSDEIKFYNEMNPTRTDWKILNELLGHWVLYVINSSINRYSRLVNCHDKLIKAKRNLKDLRELRHCGIK